MAKLQARIQDMRSKTKEESIHRGISYNTFPYYLIRMSSMQEIDEMGSNVNILSYVSRHVESSTSWDFYHMFMSH